LYWSGYNLRKRGSEPIDESISYQFILMVETITTHSPGDPELELNLDRAEMLWAKMRLADDTLPHRKSYLADAEADLKESRQK
jgi:hypothetical protein